MSQALRANVDINIVYKKNWDKYCLKFSIRYRLRYLVYLKAKTSKEWTIRKVMGAGGEEFSACTIFFFAHCLCRNFFFQVNPSARIFFQTNIAFFWTVKSWFIIYVFVLYKSFYTHNRSKDTGHFHAKSFPNCTHSERGGSPLEWTASLCIFSVPALWNSSSTAHHNDSILHSPKQPLCPLWMQFFIVL